MIDIKLQQEVKQRDSLSPLIFNLVMEPMLKLESQPGSNIGDEAGISVLASANNIIITVNTVPQARYLLRIAEGYLKKLGMHIVAAKCAITITKDSWYLTDSALTLLSGNGISYANAGATLKYLGVKIAPWAGIDIKGLKRNLCTVIQRIRKLEIGCAETTLKDKSNLHIPCSTLSISDGAGSATNKLS